MDIIITLLKIWTNLLIERAVVADEAFAALATKSWPRTAANSPGDQQYGNDVMVMMLMRRMTDMIFVTFAKISKFTQEVALLKKTNSQLLNWEILPQC